MSDDHLLVLDCLTALIHLLWSDLCAILTRCALGFEEDRCQSSNRSCRSEIEDHANNGEIFLILFDIRKSTFDQISIWATRGLSSVWCIYHNTSNYHNYEKHEITVEGILEYSASIAAWLSWECLRPNGGLVAKLHGRSTLVLLLGQNLALRAKRLHQRLSRTRTWINGILSLSYSFTQNMVLDQVSFQFMSRKPDSCWRGGVVKLMLSDYSRKGVLRKPDFCDIAYD